MGNDSPAAAPLSGLFYCGRCTRMIHPPGSQGIVAPDGMRLCQKCATEAGVGQKKDASRTGIVPAERRRQPTRAVQLPPTQAPAPKAGTPAHPGHAPTGTAATAATASAPPKPGSSVMLPAVIGAFGVVVFLVGLVVFFTTRNTPAPDALATPVAPNAKETSPVPAKPNVPAIAPAKRDPEPDKKTPEPPAKVVVAPTPPKTESRPVVTIPPGGTAPKAEDQKPAAKDDGLPAFSSELAAAAKLANEEKFGTALDLIAKLKSTHAQAPWFAAQRDKLNQTEKRVNEQLSEYTAEAEEARAQAAKAATPEELDKLEKTWKPRAAGSGAADGWALLDIVSMQSSDGATLSKIDGGSIYASGNNPQFETYTVVAQTALTGITAVRLDVLPHASLPGGGPGRNGNGNFVLSEFSVQAAPASGAMKSVQLTKATADYSQPDHPWMIEHTIDGDKRTGWAIGNTFGIPHTAVYETAAPVGELGGVRLTFTLEFRSEHAHHVLGHFRLSATTARIPQKGALAANVAPVALESAGDPMASAPARAVLKAVADTRARFGEQARQKRGVEIAGKLDLLERTLKMRPTKLDPIYKALEELEGMVALDPTAIEKYAQRLGMARFDASIARDGDLSVYRTAVKSGAGSEVSYRFATTDEFGAWTFDSPDANAGSVELDTKKSQVLLKTVQKHNWEGRDRRNMPLLRVPFYFMQDHWLVEADAELVSDGNKGAKPDFGIMVWDGGSGVARFSVADGGAKGIHVLLAVSNPKRENFWFRPCFVNGKVKDPVRLQMGCSGGIVNCTVLSKAGGTVTIGKEALGFEPKFAGIFVRTSDDQENATAAFHGFRIQGLPHLEHLKDWREAQRKNAAANEKGMLERRATMLQVLSEGLFVPMDLSKSATFCSAKRMFLGVNDEERVILPNWGMQNAGGVPFVVADPKGESVNNVILLPSPQGPACANLPRSVSLPCGSSATAIHLLGCVSGWGWAGNASEKGSLTAVIKLTYENGMVEEHRLLNGVHISDYIRQIDIPESKLAFKVGERQVRYMTLRTLKPTVAIKSIEFIKGEDKTAPYFFAVTLDRRASVPPELNSNTAARLLAPGKVGSAMVCTGSTFLETPHADDLEPAQLTIESWVYVDEHPSGGDTRRWLINKNGNEGNNGHYGLVLHDGRLLAYLNIGGQVQADGNTRLALKQWQHAAMTYDGATLKVFLNGVECGAAAVNRARTTWDRSLVIGRRQDGPFPFTGILDEVRIYSRALPAEELKAHVADPANASKDGLVRHWSFD